MERDSYVPTWGPSRLFEDVPMLTLSRERKSSATQEWQTSVASVQHMHRGWDEIKIPYVAD